MDLAVFDKQRHPLGDPALIGVHDIRYVTCACDASGQLARKIDPLLRKLEPPA